MLAKFDANNILKFSLTCYIDFKVSWQTKFQFMENTSPPEKTPTPFELSYPLKTRGGSKNLFNSLIKYLPSVYQMMQIKLFYFDWLCLIDCRILNYILPTIHIAPD